MRESSSFTSDFGRSQAPRLRDQLRGLVDVHPLQPDQDDRMAVVVGCGEELVRLGSDECVLLLDRFHPHHEGFGVVPDPGEHARFGAPGGCGRRRRPARRRRAGRGRCVGRRHGRSRCPILPAQAETRWPPSQLGSEAACSPGPRTCLTPRWSPLTEQWGLGGVSVEYLPEGFGSHHWRAESDDGGWYVTVDDLTERMQERGESRPEVLHRLAAALSTARALRDAGLDFVVAPVPTTADDIVETVGEHFAVAVYPAVDGTSHEWGAFETREERMAVLERIILVHGASGQARDHTYVEDFAVTNRGELALALDDLSEAWEGGPYSERAQQLLDRHAPAVVRLVERFDELAETVDHEPERWVVTHGEPHPGNTITTDQGVMLIDWDTALVAPPERDLRILADGAPEVLDRYADVTGVRPSGDTIELYRRSWSLTEISIFLAQFRRPHTDTEDMETSWSSLERVLESMDER